MCVEYHPKTFRALSHLFLFFKGPMFLGLLHKNGQCYTFALFYYYNRVKYDVKYDVNIGRGKCITLALFNHDFSLLYETKGPMLNLENYAV